jgi:hypothetical protein
VEGSFLLSKRLLEASSNSRKPGILRSWIGHYSKTRSGKDAAEGSSGGFSRVIRQQASGGGGQDHGDGLRMNGCCMMRRKLPFKTLWIWTDFQRLAFSVVTTVNADRLAFDCDFWQKERNAWISNQSNSNSLGGTI